MDSNQFGGAGSWSSTAPSSSTGSGTSDSYPNVSGPQGYEGYGSTNAQRSSGSDLFSDQSVYGSSWEPPRSGTEVGVAMSGDRSRGWAHQAGGGGRSSSSMQADNPDSIIAKINQRLDLLSRESGGKDTEESSFRFESFQSYMLPANNEQCASSSSCRGATAVGSEDAQGAGGGSAQALSPKSGPPQGRGRGRGGRRESSGAGENRARGRGGRDLKGGVRGGQHQQSWAHNWRGGGPWRARDGTTQQPHQQPHHHAQFSPRSNPYGHFGMPSPHLASMAPSSTFSERSSACWNELSYTGSCGPARGSWGQLPSLFPPPQPLYPDYHDGPHHRHGHVVMTGFPQPYRGGGGGVWNWNGRSRPRGDRDGRRQRGTGHPLRNVEGRKRRFSQTLDDFHAHHPGTESDEDGSEQNPFAKNEDNNDEVEERGTGKEGEKDKIDDEEYDDDDEVKKKRGRKKERQQKDHRLRFTCSMCKFRTVEEKDIQNHLEGRFHKDIFAFLASKIPEAHVKFLQEYTVNRNKKILKKRLEMLGKSESHEKSDPFIGTGQDEFLKHIEAAHCMACDMVIPAQHSLLQRHVNSQEHLCNRKGITEQLKKSSLPIAKSILNSSNISKMLEKYLKGDDPFTEELGDHDPEDDCDLMRAGLGEQGASGARSGTGLHQDVAAAPEGAKNDGKEDEASEDEEKGDLEEPQEFLEEFLDEDEDDENPMV